MRRKITFAILGVVALALGAHYLSASRTNAEVQRLIGEAHSRGINTGLQMPERLQYTGRTAAGRLSGIERLQALRELEVVAQNIDEARQLIVSAEPYFAPISEFAELEQYAPDRNLEDDNAFQDIGPISAAVHAEGWRGYLAASDGDVDQAFKSIRVLKGFMERMQDERYPIGLYVASKAQNRLTRIVLRMADDSKDPALLERLLRSAKTLPVIDFKSAFEASTGAHMRDIDNYENGKYEAQPPKRILGLKYSFDKTSAYYDVVRKQLLEFAIAIHDDWETREIEMNGDPSFNLMDMELADEILGSFRFSTEHQLRFDRHAMSNRRALLLTLAAYAHRSRTRTLPTIEDLEKQGFDATDPWGGEKMTLHEDGGRIWVGGLRKNRQAIQPAPLQTMEILEWRP